MINLSRLIFLLIYTNVGSRPPEKCFVTPLGIATPRLGTTVVDRDANPRSYVVQSQHGLVRRNRRHLFKANPTANFDSNTQCVDDAGHYTNGVCNNSRNFVCTTTPHIRTSCFGRRITHPRKLDDYV